MTRKSNMQRHCQRNAIIIALIFSLFLNIVYAQKPTLNISGTSPLARLKECALLNSHSPSDATTGDSQRRQCNFSTLTIPSPPPHLLPIPAVEVVEPATSDVKAIEDAVLEVLPTAQHNFALDKDGAKVLASNPNAKHVGAILDDDSDTFMRNECKDDKWVVFELSQVAKVARLEIVQHELYSSRVKTFEVRGRQSHPRIDNVETSKGLNSTAWKSLGVFHAEKTKGTQSFVVQNPLWVRYMLLRFIDHYGSESVCAINGLAVYGKSAAEELEDQLAGDITTDSWDLGTNTNNEEEPVSTTAGASGSEGGDAVRQQKGSANIHGDLDSLVPSLEDDTTQRSTTSTKTSTSSNNNSNNVGKDSVGNSNVGASHGDPLPIDTTSANSQTPSPLPNTPPSSSPLRTGASSQKKASQEERNAKTETDALPSVQKKDAHTTNLDEKKDSIGLSKQQPGESEGGTTKGLHDSRSMDERGEVLSPVVDPPPSLDSSGSPTGSPPTPTTTDTAILEKSASSENNNNKAALHRANGKNIRMKGEKKDPSSTEPSDLLENGGGHLGHLESLPSSEISMPTTDAANENILKNKVKSETAAIPHVGHHRPPLIQDEEQRNIMDSATEVITKTLPSSSASSGNTAHQVTDDPSNKLDGDASTRTDGIDPSNASSLIENATPPPPKRNNNNNNSNNNQEIQMSTTEGAASPSTEVPPLGLDISLEELPVPKPKAGSSVYDLIIQEIRATKAQQRIVVKAMEALHRNLTLLSNTVALMKTDYELSDSELAERVNGLVSRQLQTMTAEIRDMKRSVAKRDHASLSFLAMVAGLGVGSMQGLLNAWPKSRNIIVVLATVNGVVGVLLHVQGSVENVLFKIW